MSGGLLGKPAVRAVVVVVAVVGVAASAFAFGSTRANRDSDFKRPAQPTILTEPVVRTEIEGTFTVAASPLGESSVGFNCVPKGAVEVDRWVFTAAPVASGDSVHEGQVVVEISGRPVFVIEGDVPAYRSIEPGDDGTDVRILQEALQRLGFYDGEIDGDYSSGTWQAVAAMYEAAGYEPFGPSEELLEQIDAVRAAVDDAADQSTRVTSDEEYEIIKHQHAAAMEELRKLQAIAGPSVPFCEVLVVSSLPSLVSTEDGSAPDESTSDDAVPAELGEGLVWIEFGKSERSVEGIVSKNQAGELSEGDPATFISGDERIYGVVEKVSESAPFTVEVKLDDSADVSAKTSGELEFNAKSSAGAVLAISTGAPTEASDGKWYVTRVELGDTTTRVEVELGSTDGMLIEVTSSVPQLAEGDQLLVGTIDGT